MLSYEELKQINEQNKQKVNKGVPYFDIIRIVDLEYFGLVLLVNKRRFRTLDTLYTTITQGHGYVTNLSRIKGVYNKRKMIYNTSSDAFMVAMHHGYTSSEYKQDLLDEIDVQTAKYT